MLYKKMLYILLYTKWRNNLKTKNNDLYKNKNRWCYSSPRLQI